MNTLANLRDVAHLVPGLKLGVLWRSDAPHFGDLPPEGHEPWPPSLVVDLRDEAERSHGHPLAESTVVVAVPVFADAAVQAQAGGGTLKGLYAQMIKGEAAARLVEAVTVVAGADGPSLVHCSAGKDRTGLTVALALALIGVERRHIVEDYVLTTESMPGVIARMSRQFGIGDGAANLAEIPQEVLQAPAYAIESVLDVWEAHPGGVEEWFYAAGGEAAVVTRLRERLLDA
ncbi:tyrosine-protein phosphatase [Demequina capsici]|uniref:Tyrosine-protein phosphatase n=1 Tax=Demequina capsici TaxID=3075620 RepID=A0AA96FA69_9MICO|nr:MULTISPECIES: tyrosine-protein phosphatase [unclassified Demequina]WNM23759.1 tyrosine-protein phosphatase [Demequina sp. OYTSA14]WNM26598.1 tyrosine-protein phosphatase [Demequina sp. PMTSA13]